MAKKLFIKTWGCQMNVYDSTRMSDILAPLGYVTTDAPDDADMMILNTCHIREKATDKVFSELGRLKQFKLKKEENGGRVLMAVAGCVAQAEGEYILERAPYIDMVFGPQTYHTLPEMVVKAMDSIGSPRIVSTDMAVDDKFDALPQDTHAQGSSAYLSIQEGCDKFCTFCVVPYTRGAEYSRPTSQVMDEAKSLIKQGVKELTLLGQNVNAYHGESPDKSTWGLGRLIRELADLDGLERIRYMTSHPNDMQDDLITAHGEVDKLMPFLHLPVQHGSDKMLKLMNRKHTADKYREIIDKVRTQRPDIALSSDFIVGFPGETDQDHQDMLKLVSDINYSVCYSFKYSPRPGTPGAKMMGVVPEKIKSERLTELQELLFAQQLDFNKSLIGKTIPILFDRKGKQEGQLLGRSPYMQSSFAIANERIFGQIVDMKVTAAHTNSISGEIVTTETTTTKGSTGRKVA